MSPVILPVPHVQQHQRGECLASCAMVLAYLGVSVAYGRLLKLLRVKTQIGAPASNIRNLKKLGLDVIYQQGTLAELHHHLTSHRPCIAFVKTSELPYWAEQTNHAVVLTIPLLRMPPSRFLTAILAWLGWSGVSFMPPLYSNE